MPVKFIFNSDLNELDLLLLYEILFKLKDEIDNAEDEYYKLSYNYSHLLEHYNREQILRSLDKLYKIGIFRNDQNREYKLIIDIRYRNNECELGLFNVKYLQENFFIIKEDNKIMNDTVNNNYQTINDIITDEIYTNVKTKVYTSFNEKIEEIITTDDTPATALYNYKDVVFGDAVIFIIQEKFHQNKYKELKQINDYRYVFSIDNVNRCVVIQLLFPSCYYFKIKLYSNSKYTFRKILKNEKMYIVFYNRETGRSDIKRMPISKFQDDFRKFLNENYIEY